MHRITFPLLLLLISGCSQSLKIPQCMHDQTCSPQVIRDYLKSVCELKKEKLCCLASLNSMNEQGYSLASEGPSACPPGQKVEQLRCQDSLKWCSPQ